MVRLLDFGDCVNVKLIVSFLLVPIITEALMARPESKNINLKGIATGDGCLGDDVLCGSVSIGGPWYDIVFFYGHAQISNSFYSKILSQCPIEELKQQKQTPKCAALIKEMYANLGQWNAYALYNDCVDNQFGKRSNIVYNYPIVGYPCSGTAMNLWLNLPETRQALHVNESSFFFDADNGNGFNYTLTAKDVRPFYIRLLKNETNRHLRMLVFNGDTDPSLSSFRTQEAWFPYLESQDIPVSQEWRPWNAANETITRGYVQEWQGGQFSYLTIRGSGHMVSEFKPKAAQLFMSDWIKGVDFPKYNPPPQES